MKYRKFVIGRKFWLVPTDEATDLFADAVQALNGTPDGAEVNWNDAQQVEFMRVCNLPTLFTANL